MKVVGNFMLGLWELNVRRPKATHFAMFQDDIEVVPCLRKYLESCNYPKNGYWNLYTFKENAEYSNRKPGWRLSNQRGLGALGYVFDKETMIKVLTSRHMVCKPHGRGARSWKALDGGIVDGLRKQGCKEFIHNPSLVQHKGTQHSTLGNLPRSKPYGESPEYIEGWQGW